MAGDGGALIWPQLIGFARAKEYLFTGDLMTAAEAERIGLINHVVPADQLDEKVYGLARRLAGGARPDGTRNRRRWASGPQRRHEVTRQATDGMRSRGSGSQRTLCWREMDLNFKFRAK